MGFSGALAAHLTLVEYWMTGFWVHIALFMFSLSICFCCEYNPRDNSKTERLKADRANWAQVQALIVGLAIFMGGLIRWVV